MSRKGFLSEYHKLRVELDGLVLGNVNISIRNGEREVWNCNDGEWKDSKFRKFKVVQNFDSEQFISELLSLLDRINKHLEKIKQK